MVKIPVQKTVLRNGKPHIQTYWEQSGASEGKTSTLSNLSPSLPSQPDDTQVNEIDPVRQAWRRTQLIPVENRTRHAHDIEACIAAGFTPEAAIYLQGYVLEEGQSLASYIYDNGLDQQTHPRSGWRFTKLGQDHRTEWIKVTEEIGVSMDHAIEWCDAGLDYPWPGITELIRSGVDPQRAKEWEQDAGATGISAGAHLYLYKEELLSGMSLDEARLWRKAMKQSHALGERQIGFYQQGFKPEDAARWDNILYYDVTAETATKLRDLKWSPSSVKSALRALPGSRGSDKLTVAFAEEIIRATPQVGGPKIVREWMELVQSSFAEGFSSPAAVKAVNAAEEWKREAESKTGIPIPADINHIVAELHPQQRAAYIEIMSTPGREADKPKYAAVRGMDVAKAVGTRENAVYLKEQGFPLGSTVYGVVYASTKAKDGLKSFHLPDTDPVERARWMRTMAVSFYWKNTYDAPVTQSDREKIIGNDAIDPLKLKDVLLDRQGEVKALQLEGMVLSGISSPVAEGWL